MNNQKNLENIPTKYHSVFTTDWNKGEESTMTAMEKCLMNELYLDYMRWDTFQRRQVEICDSILTEEMIEKEKM